MGDDSSALRYRPFGKAAVKAVAAKQAAKECSSEKRFSAPWAFPIRQTGGEEEVTNEG